MALRPVNAGLRDEPVTLPKVRSKSTTSVEQELLKCRSVREFRDVHWQSMISVNSSLHLMPIGRI